MQLWEQNEIRRLSISQPEAAGKISLSGKLRRTQEAKADIVVAVVRIVVVAISRTAVPGIVVPVAAPINPVRAIIDRYP